MMNSPKFILCNEKNCELTKDMLETVLVDSVDYDKDKLILALTGHTARGVCGRDVYDVVTGKKIKSSYSVMDDGVYAWPDFIVYYIKNYNIRIDHEILKHFGVRYS